MRSIDPDDFRSAVDEGIVALQKAGADVVLINPQYSPRTETMISVPPYIDNMRAVAQEHEVPLFDRFGIMHQWNDQGDFDLFSTTHGIDLAKRVHDCLGRALSKFIIDAAHQPAGAAELGFLVNDVAGLPPPFLRARHACAGAGRLRFARCCARGNRAAGADRGRAGLVSLRLRSRQLSLINPPRLPRQRAAPRPIPPIRRRKRPSPRARSTP